MKKLYVDIETYSATDLKKTSVYRYAQDEDFEVMMAGWGYEDGPIHLAVGKAEIDQIPGLFDADVLKVAHNAQFERVCFSAYVGLKGNGRFLPPAHWDDTAARAAEWGYPRSLAELAIALGAEEKDSAGTHLINWFCKPDRNGNRRLPEDHPEKWEQFKAYCVQDVVTLREIDQALPDWPTEDERELYLVDQAINDAGILIDTEMAEAAIEEADNNRMEQELEICQITGVDNPGSNQQMMAWFAETGLEMPNLQAATVQAALEREEISEDHRRVLELRQELALVAAKKYSAALNYASTDDRLRGAFQFFGAHTGRWAGRGVQLQNLPSASIVPKDTPDERVDSILEGTILDLKLGSGADAHTLKALVRQMFEGPFTVVDYAAIEARVIAWLAGETWAIKAFEAGRDIYVETAERMGGLTRKEGKVAVLALGYQGGVGSLQAMGAEGDRDHLQFLVNQWRDANTNIVNLWAEMDAAFRSGDVAVGHGLYVTKDGADRYIRLPSGRSLAYRGLKGRIKTTPWGGTVKQVSFLDPKRRGLRTDTYGGRLIENVTQAVARDVLAEALRALHREGYKVVGHVHDEILVEGRHGVDTVSEVMTRLPSWAEGLPLSAEGFLCERYRKG